MISWPADLINDVARRRSVIFLGAGVSSNSVNAQGRSPRTWGGFLEDCAAGIQQNRHIKQMLSKGDYLTACDVIERSLGRDVFIQALRDEFLTPQYHHASIHELIFQIDSRIVATPNFDKIYETYANHAANASVIIKHHYDPDVTDAIREDGRLVLKVHGTIDSPNRMIFTRSEYAKARSDHRHFYQVLDALALTNTFLFLGCGVNDPDLKLLLEDAFFRHPLSRKHVMVIPQKELHPEVKVIVEETMNLRILEYSAANSHAQLMTSLQELAAKVEARRDELRQSGNW